MNDKTITALVVDTRESICLLETVIEDLQLPLKIIALNNFTNASTFLNLTRDLPDALIVGSGIILREGNEKLLEIIHDGRFTCMRLFVLIEFPGEEKHLCGAERLNATYITMPSGYDEMVGVVRGIYEGALAHFGNSKKKSGQIV